MKRIIYLFSLLLATSFSSFAVENQRNVIYVNSDVTTHILMPENLKMVDISTDNLVGNQCADNMIRIKPANIDSIGNRQTFNKGQFLGAVTMIGERHIVQYDIRYEPNPMNADAMYRVSYDDSFNYSNPETVMPESEMARLAWTAYGSKRKFHNIRSSQYGIKGEVFNIYTVGNYFFIDFVLTNETKIPYDISEMRISLSDKKETKATNFQTIELTPLFVLNDAKAFKKGFRQVIVLDKLTFPNEKILKIEVSENQISGRVVTIPIQYEDILNADCFDMDKINNDIVQVKYVNNGNNGNSANYNKLQKDYDALSKSNSSLTKDYEALKKEVAKSQEAQKREADLIKQCDDLTKTNNNLKEELEAARKQLAKLKESINALL